MKYHFSTAIFALLAALMLAAPSPAARARQLAPAITQACSGGIAGTVFASDTDMPLAGVTVTASLLDVDFTRSVITDAAGHYTIGALPAGTYQVQFAPDPDTQSEYLGEYFNDQFDAPPADQVTVAAGAVAANINATLDLGGTISGQVLGADTGAGLSGVLVEIARGDADPVEAITDDNGEYRSGPLATGSYKVTFIPPDGEPAYLQAVYSRQPGGAATLVPVLAPEETPHINATLGLGGQIRGRVVGDDAIGGLGDVSVEVYSSSGEFVTSASTDADGYYATPGLRSGSYKLLFDTSLLTSTNAYLPAYYNQRPNLGTADNVAVAAPFATTADIQLSKGGQFTGTVTASGGQVLPDVEVRVYSGAGELAGTATSDENGVYLTPALAPGSYKLLFKPLGDLANSYAFEYHSNRATLGAADLLVAPSPGVATQINAVLAGGGSIGGNVKLFGSDLCGAALASAGVTITIFDADGRAAAFVQPNDAGNYRTPALPPGIYRVGFEGPAGFLGQFYNKQLNLAAAQPIAVNGATVPNINARLVPGKVFMPSIGKYYR